MIDTRRLAMARPRPVPLFRRVNEVSACQTSVNTLSCSSDDMPMPVSTTWS